MRKRRGEVVLLVSNTELMNKTILSPFRLFLFQQETASVAFPFYLEVELSMARDFPVFPKSKIRAIQKVQSK